MYLYDLKPARARPCRHPGDAEREVLYFYLGLQAQPHVVEGLDVVKCSFDVDIHFSICRPLRQGSSVYQVKEKQMQAGRMMKMGETETPSLSENEHRSETICFRDKAVGQ